MKQKKLKVLMLSAELNPLAKAGGLGDVVGALPKALVGSGCEVVIMLPFYGFIDKKKYDIKKICDKVKVETGEGIEKVSLWETNLPGSNVRIILIRHNYFSGKEIYVGGRVDLDKGYTRLPGDIKRFAFFTMSSLAAAEALACQPDVIHCHDWHVAMTPDLIRQNSDQNSFYKNTKILYTIHNLANQGVVEATEILPYLKLEKILDKKGQVAGHDHLNFMQRGIINADLVNTVSPTYAKEILAKEQGAGLEKNLRSRKQDLSGILNGIDVDCFNPATDKAIKKKYSSANLPGKVANKLALQKELGLPEDKNIPLVGVVSRFTSQKGLDLIDDSFAALPCQFVFLGTGQKECEDELRALAKKYPAKFSVQIKFDAALAQRIYASSDIFLMPSRFEPCGLGQMIAMRYGTVPVVRATGGLADTVDARVGFSFKKYSNKVLRETLRQALDTYIERPKSWNKLQLTGMKQDFSWTKSAKEYVKLYKKLANNK